MADKLPTSRPCLHRTALHIHTQNGIRMCVASHIARYSGTLIGYSTDCSLSVAITGLVKCLRLLTPRRAFISLLVKLTRISLWNWSHCDVLWTTYYRNEVRGIFKIKFSVPCILVETSSNIPTKFTYICIITTFLLHVSVFYTPEIRVALPEDVE